MYGIQYLYTFQINYYSLAAYDGGLLVRGMYPTSFFASNTLKINGFAMNQENLRTTSPLL